MSPRLPRSRGSFVSRYGVVAACCAVLHNTIVIGAAAAGTGVVSAAALSFCLMVVIGYLLLCAVAFRTAPTRRGFLRYCTAMAANFPLSTGLLWLFAVPLHLPIAIVAPMVTLLMMAINFFGARWAIHRGPHRIPSSCTS